MAKTKRTLTQTDEIVKSCASLMEGTAERLERIAGAMKRVLGPTEAIVAILNEAGNLRGRARHSLGKLQ